MVMFNSKLEDEDGYVGSEIDLKNKTERLVCRKLRGSKR